MKFCQNVTMNEQSLPAQDPKLKVILKAAFDSFAQYGFRRTTMEDIARAAGISRPALYLHFRNKQDVFRALAQYYYDDAATQVGVALAQPGSPVQVLKRAFAAQSGQIKEAILTSPHGDELMDTGSTTSADIAEAGEARLAALYSDWLQREIAVGRIAPQRDTQALGRLFVDALNAVKKPPYQQFVQQRDLLAEVFGKGLRR